MKRREEKKFNELSSDDVLGMQLVFVSAKGRVEHQKMNQTAALAAVWLSFWCSTHFAAKKVTRLMRENVYFIKNKIFI